MKRTYKLQNLDCAHCAAIMESKIQKIPGVTSATISFMTQKMTLEVDTADFDAVLTEVIRICKKVEPDMIILI